VSHRLAQTFNQAFSLHRNGELARARVLYERILAEDANHFDALHLSGVIAAQCKDPLKAAQLISRAILVDGNHPAAFAAHNNLGNALKELHQPQAALAHLDLALAKKPDFADAHKNRGSVLQDLKHYAAAIASFDRAIALNLSDAGVHYCRGNCLDEAGRPEEALASYEVALSIKPDFVLAHLNRANVLRSLARFDEARADYAAAIGHDPACAAAQLGLSTLLLLHGEFAEGLRLYEWRWKTDDAPLKVADKRRFKRPQWHGEGQIGGKTLLIHHEQGLGDAIQFSRYATLAAAQGAEVILEVRPQLAGLLAGLTGVSKQVILGEPLPPFALHTPLMSLPRCLGTRMDNIPSAVSYVSADAHEVAAWQAQLGPKERPRVGLAWRGNPAHAADRTRSIPFAQLLAALPDGIEYVSLQKELPAQEEKELAASRVVRPELGDFKHTAALCECLDLIVTVDTSTVHLAGALGRPTWLLLSASPDWRWFLERCDSPWYPSVELLRQRAVGDWPSVLSQLSGRLRERFS
jgi:tetratricopeptide (TPR) repeat protein